MSATAASTGRAVRRPPIDRTRDVARSDEDPAPRDMPVHQTAVRRGFNGHSTCTRAFRAAYGVSPRDHRHDAPTDLP